MCVSGDFNQWSLDANCESNITWSQTGSYVISITDGLAWFKIKPLVNLFGGLPADGDINHQWWLNVDAHAENNMTQATILFTGMCAKTAGGFNFTPQP
jgi:hypothetical protein